MTLRKVWTINFGTTASLLVLLLGMSLGSINLRQPDKDIIIVYFAGFIGLYLGLLTYLYYKKIYQWGNPNRNSFYIMYDCDFKFYYSLQFHWDRTFLFTDMGSNTLRIKHSNVYLGTDD